MAIPFDQVANSPEVNEELGDQHDDQQD